MNFLAHQYLSYQHESVMVGNFIADTITGSISEEYEAGVQLGIQIHRSIDSFTDSHSLVLDSRKLLYPYFGKYAAVVQDVYYDHFLAINWGLYSNSPLEPFVSNVYDVLNKYKDSMNDRALRTLHYMQLQDWLFNYSTLEGIDRALKGLSRRASFQSNMEKSLPALKANYEALNTHFKSFFPDLEEEVKTQYSVDLAALHKS